MQANSGKAEDVAPQIAGKVRVTVAYDGPWKPMGPDNTVKESACHRDSSVRMCQWYEVCIFGEVINNRNDHSLAMDTGKGLNKYPTRPTQVLSGAEGD